MQGSFHKRIVLIICTKVSLSHTYLTTVYNTYLPAIIICLIAIHSPLTTVIKLCVECATIMHNLCLLDFLHKIFHYNLAKQIENSVNIFTI
jgi:hypothetical protein